MIKRFAQIALMSWIGLSGELVSKPLAQEPAEDRVLATRIDQYANRLVDGGFSGSLLVMREGKILLAKGYGFAHQENMTLNTPDTVFDIGSNTKQFTAAAILKLVEGGHLSLDDRMDAFFEHVPNDKAGISVHQLLTHSSGLSDAARSSDVDFVSAPAFRKRLFETELDFPPGVQFSYSNPGYSMLGMIIEKVSGQSYEAYLQEALFTPAGMVETGYLLPDWGDAKLAHGYFNSGDRLGPMIDYYQADGVSWNLVGNGGLASSLNDLVKWFIALENDSVLSERSRALLTASHIQQSPGEEWFYGYGWGVGDTKSGKRLAVHSGSNSVFFAKFYRFIDEEINIAFLTNTGIYDGLDDVGFEISKMVFELDYEGEPVSPNPYGVIANFVIDKQPSQVQTLPKYFKHQTGEVIDDRNLLNRIGNHHVKSGNYGWAIALLKLNVELFPKDGNLWDTLGEAYLAAADPDTAKTSFQTALDLAIDDDCSWCTNAREKLQILSSP